MKLSDEIMAALESGDLVIVPRCPTGAMQAAAYYAGRVGDSGGAERCDFVEEWDAAIEQWTDGGKPSGLLHLVRPVSWDDDPETETLRAMLFPPIVE